MTSKDLPVTMVLCGVGEFYRHLELPQQQALMTANDREELKAFLAFTALHGAGLYQTQTAVQTFPWLLQVWWQTAEHSGYGWLKLDSLWHLKTFEVEQNGPEPATEAPAGYAHCTVAELALLELTAALPKSLAQALTQEPVDEDAAEERLDALLFEYNARKWGVVDWFVCQTGYADKTEQRRAVHLKFTDGSELFITAYGPSLQPPPWLDEDDASPDMLRVAGLRADTPCHGNA